MIHSDAFDKPEIETSGITKPEKFFLCFGFENFSPLDLEKFHVTLIYLGAEEGITWPDSRKYKWLVEDVIKTVDEFMLDKNRTLYGSFSMVFEEKEMFGRNKDIPVLLPSLETYPMNVQEWVFLKKLCDELQQFQFTGQFPFRPHLSTDLHFFSGTVGKLFLCGKGYKIYKEWDLD